MSDSSRAAKIMKTAKTLEARALWFDAPRSAELRVEEVPPPGFGEVRVCSDFSAVSHGTEMLVYRGEVSGELPLDLPTLRGGYDFPIKFGYAVVGRISSVGPGASGFSPGDMVFVHHPHQEVFNVPASMPVRLPGDIDPLRGVFFANVETALNIVHDAPVKLGESVVVFGQGVVGLLVTRLLGLSGASVISVDPIRKRRELSLRFGARLALDPNDDEVDNEVARRVFEETDGRGADVAVEVSGAAPALQSALDCVAAEGTVVAGSWHGTKPIELDLGGRFHRGRVKIKSSQVGSISPELGARWDRDRRASAVLELMPGLGLGDLVSRRIPFEGAPEAYRSLDRSPDEEAVQIVFEYGWMDPRE